MAGIISLFMSSTPQVPVSPLGPLDVTLSQVNYSLENRYDNTFVNDVFADNILLTLAYMNGTVKQGEPISWERVRTPFTYRLVLNPGEVFAFHEKVSEEYRDKEIVTTKAHFNSTEGFRSDGWLVGDGVCHLASFINVAALKAELQVSAPTDHDFARIADVPKEYGVSIYYDPSGARNTQNQNLYITNNRDKKVAFVFRYRDNKLDIYVSEVVS